MHDSNKHCLWEFDISGKFCCKNFALMNNYEVKLPYSFLS